MKIFPIDSNRIGTLQFLNAGIKYGDKAKTVQKTNHEEVPMWEIEVLRRPESGKSEVEQIVVPAAKCPDFDTMTPLAFENLRARPWDMGGGNTGVTISADSVSDAETGELFNG